MGDAAHDAIRPERIAAPSSSDWSRGISKPGQYVVRTSPPSRKLSPPLRCSSFNRREFLWKCVRLPTFSPTLCNGHRRRHDPSHQ